MRIIIALMAVAFALAGCTTANEAVKAAAPRTSTPPGFCPCRMSRPGTIR